MNPQENRKVEYAYAMASTLNQMINYIPLKMKWEGLKLTNIYNITLKKHQDENKQRYSIKENENWDKNFKDIVTGTGHPIKDIKIEEGNWRHVGKTVKAIKHVINKEDKPLFWNITGGQRPFLLAVFEITKHRPNDIIAYLEGNTGNIVLSKYNEQQKLICIESNKTYQIEGLTINIALQLMGFEVAKEGKGRTEGFTTLQNHPHKDFFIKLTDTVCSKDKLRLALIATNKRDRKEKALLEIKNNFTKEFDSKELKILTDYLTKYKKYPFGYMLEYMAAFKILSNHAITTNIADINVSASLYFSNKERQKRGGGSSIDEFDIAILTKTGQLIVLECKSGRMSGDVGKSTNYSTYAAAGVYGKPILITPLKKLEKNIPEDSSMLQDELFKDIKSAVRSAERATLEVWGLDEIESKMKEKLGI